MRVLIITKIFPNALEPLSSPFNRQQFAELGKLCEVEVLATIPWFPGARAFGRWSAAGRLVGVPARDAIAGLPVAHPRTLFLPRVGHGAAAALYAISLLPSVMRRRGRFDVVLGSWAYPDGAAAIALARLLGVPSVVKLHGSDINVVSKLRGPRANLQWALPRARRVVAVSRPLAEEAIALGVARERVVVVQNGVDGALFHPRDRAAARAKLGLADRKWVVYVGRLVREKGVLDLLRAISGMQDISLALVGDGAAREECRALSGANVKLAGARPLEEIPEWMAAADVVTLPSWNEGTPNVILEAFACGRPVVGTRVGGIPDLIADPSLGELCPARDPDALTAALRRALSRSYDSAEIASRGARGGWAESARKLHDVLREACA